jgi:hypothetical protein
MRKNRSRQGRALAVARDVLRCGSVMAMVVASWSVLFAQAPAPAPSGKPAAPAQAGSLPPARSILDKHLEAIGGRTALLRHSSMIQRGTLSMPKAGLTGDLIVYRAKPNKSIVKITLPGVGQVTEAFDGTHGWSESPMTGPMVLDGKQLADRRFDSEFFGELHDDSRYASITTLERTEFEGRPCFKVRFVRKTGTEDIEFYDVETGLKAGSISTRETPMGTITGTSAETDYRKFGSLLHATKQRIQMAGVEQVITVTAVEYDAVPPAVFEIPVTIKALIK